MVGFGVLCFYREVATQPHILYPSCQYRYTGMGRSPAWARVAAVPPGGRCASSSISMSSVSQPASPCLNITRALSYRTVNCSLYVDGPRSPPLHTDTHTLRVPHVYTTGLLDGPRPGSFIVMEALDLSGRVDQAALGRALAHMHLATPQVGGTAETCRLKQGV